MNSVTINGKTYTGHRSISVRNNVVIIDGKRVDHGDVENGILEVHITGTLESLDTDASVVANDVHNVVAGGSVSCDNVRGSVQAGGSVSCDSVGGSVMAGGSVSHG